MHAARAESSPEPSSCGRSNPPSAAIDSLRGRTGRIVEDFQFVSNDTIDLSSCSLTRGRCSHRLAHCLGHTAALQVLRPLRLNEESTSRGQLHYDGHTSAHAHFASHSFCPSRLSIVPLTLTFLPLMEFNFVRTMTNCRHQLLL